MDVPAAAISAATPADVRAADYGGWGYRNHGGTTAMLVSSGPAVVVDRPTGRKVAVSGGSTDSAEQLAAGPVPGGGRARRRTAAAAAVSRSPDVRGPAVRERCLPAPDVG